MCTLHYTWLNEHEGCTQDSQALTRLVDSLFCTITCSLENNAFSVLHYVVNVVVHYYMLHRFEFFSAPGIVSRTALLGLRLSASHLREDACLSNHISLGSIMLTCQGLLCINCFTSLVSFTGFYTAR